MGSNAVPLPPDQIPPHVLQIGGLFLLFGGSAWTLCYVLSIREAFRSKSYGMPLFALALNFGWEIILALYVHQPLFVRVIYTVWLIVDCGMVYAAVKFGKYEWGHAPLVANHIGKIFGILATGATLGFWCFAKWWIENDLGKREGVYYKGLPGPDTQQLGFWSGEVCLIFLSAGSLCQLVIRQHSGGVNYTIW